MKSQMKAAKAFYQQSFSVISKCVWQNPPSLESTGIALQVFF